MRNQSAAQQVLAPELEAVPITFSVVNRKKDSDEFAFLFMSDNKERDAEWGNLDVTIGNTGETPIELSGKSRLEVKIPADLLKDTEVAGIGLSAASKQVWEIAAKADGLVLKLVNGKTLVITKGQPQKISLEGALAAKGQPLDRSFTFIWSAFGELRDNSRSFRISREFIPDEKDRDAYLGCTWLERTEYRNSTRAVYPTPFEIKTGRPGIGNRLILQIENLTAEPLESANAEFLVTMPTDTSASPGAALCTNEQLNEVSCRPIAPTSALWSQEPLTDGKTRYWVLKPPAGSTKIFDKSNMASFEFTNLVTQKPLGSSPVLVHWRGIKGRSSGYRLIPVTRVEAEPYVVSYQATMGGKPLKNNDPVDFKDKISLDWKIFAADSCVISGVQELLPSEGNKDVLPVEKISTFRLTPQITINGHIKTGNDGIFYFPVRPPKAKLTVSRDTVIRPDNKIKLAWECESGDCFLTMPDSPRHAVDRSGSLECKAEQDAYSYEGVYKVECVGWDLARSSATVKFPLANAVVKLKPTQAADKVELSWTSSNAAGCKATKKMGDIVLSSEKQGSVEVEIPQSPSVGVWGNGQLSIGYIVQQPLAQFPEVTVQETVSGKKYKFSWEVKNAASCEVTAPGFKSKALKGEHEWSPEIAAERLYTIGATAHATVMSVLWKPSYRTMP